MRKLLFVFAIMSSVFARAQVITTFPSLLIHANSRGMGMGDAGIASAEGTQQLLYNPAKTAFTQNYHEASISYMPWLTGISNDTRMLNASYVGNTGNAAWGLSLNYLRLGSMDTRDDNGATLSSYTAHEYNFGGSFALRLNDHHSLSTSFKFLAQNAYEPNPVNVMTVCGDIGYYGFTELGDVSRKLEWGATVTNLGATKFNLPRSAGIGIAYSNLSELGSFTVCLDVNRLLNDKWKSLRYTAGAEYGYDEQFFLRGGVSLENLNSGNRKFFSLGAGYKGFVSDQSWNIDLHYLVPFGFNGGISPFQNSWGLSLGISIGNFQ